MAGLTSGLNPSAVKTAIDEFVKGQFDRGSEPGEVMATDPVFFNQRPFDKGSVIVEEAQGVGSFEEVQEEEEFPTSNIRSGNQQSTRIRKYIKSYYIPEEFFEDDQHEMVEFSVESVGRRAQTSRDKFGFQLSYGDAFSGVTTPDGNALVSNSHTALDGSTVDNLETGSLTADNLETVVDSLTLQQAQDGELGGHNPAGLLVPRELHPEAVRIADSELRPGTADNDLNYFSNVYPGMQVGSSAYLDSTYNTLNSNADSSYFVVSRNHQINRWERRGLKTRLIPPENDRADRYEYRASFREVISADGWMGLVGSNGTA